MTPRRYFVTTLNLRVLKRWALLTALEKHGQNRTKAARELGISIRSVRQWIRDMKHTIDDVSH
jgi:transcriptional regulator with PAS, ATPase and Fis domain